MKVGDVVRVTNPKLKSYMTDGIVKFLAYAYPENMWEVKLDTGKWINIKESNLELTTVIGNVQSMGTTDNDKYLAFVHYHDFDENPSTLEEMFNLFDENEIGQPELVVYGTKCEILEQILNDSGLESYMNAFIILNQDVYPLKKSITVDW